MAWHKFATIKTDGDGDFDSLISLFCTSAQVVNYEVHEVAETKPDTIAAIYSGSSNFGYAMDEINLALTGETANTEYDLWLDLTTQVYTTLDILVLGGTETIPSVNLSNSVLDVATYSLNSIGLQTIIGITSLTALSTLNISNNSMTSEQLNPILLDLYDYAIDNLKTDGVVNIAGNEPPTGDGLQALEALIGKGWNGGTGITNIKNVYDLQAMILNRSGSYELCNDIEAEETENWNDGAGFRKIGETQATSFKGSFDGRGHIVKNLYIKPQIKGWTRDYVGLFGNFEKCTIKNVGLENISVYGRYYCGAIGECTSGAAGNAYTIENVWATGKVVGESSNGGLFGRMYNALSVVKNIWCDVDVVNNLTLLPSNDSGSIAVRIYCQFINSHSQNKNLPAFNWVDDTATITGIKQSKNSPDWESGKAVALALLRHYNGKHYAATKALSAAENITSPDLSEDWRELDITTLTAAEFKGKYNFTGWDFKKVWAMGYDYPILRAFIKKIKTEFLRFRSRLEGRLR